MLPYDPNTLRNLPKYAHELEEHERERVAKLPAKPAPKVDLRKLMKKWEKK